MTYRRTARPVDTSRKPWDWSAARVTDPAPCDLCGEPAVLRHPDNPRLPRHKTCDGQQSSAA